MDVIAVASFKEAVRKKLFYLVGFVTLVYLILFSLITYYYAQDMNKNFEGNNLHIYILWPREWDNSLDNYKTHKKMGICPGKIYRACCPDNQILNFPVCFGTGDMCYSRPSHARQPKCRLNTEGLVILRS